MQALKQRNLERLLILGFELSYEVDKGKFENSCGFSASMERDNAIFFDILSRIQKYQKKDIVAVINHVVGN